MLIFPMSFICTKYKKAKALRRVYLSVRKVSHFKQLNGYRLHMILGST